MTIVGTAYGPWQFWDGRKDSQWAQALGPLENPLEHGTTRTAAVRLLARAYRNEYEAVFGRLPDVSRLPASAGPQGTARERAAWRALSARERESVTRAFSNLGKAIAAYERRLRPGAAPFDRYVRGERGALSREAEAGLRLFVGRAGCVSCHNGPQFTNGDFHNTGVPPRPGKAPDRGRADGALLVRRDEFNCLSRFSDARRTECGELDFLVTGTPRLQGAFKPPSLRNVAGRGPFMHAGQIPDLDAVLQHYSTAPRAALGHSELTPLRLTARERAQLKAFLRSLSGPLDAPRELLRPPR
jgi:cytochrome c peroxidase